MRKQGSQAVKILAALLAVTASAPAYAAYPIGMCWDVVSSGPSTWDYTFTLTVNSATAPGHINWLLFSDYGSAAPTGATGIVGATMLSMPTGTSWTGLSSSSGYHNGPTFLSTSPDIANTGWYVTGTVGQSITWSVRGTNLVPDTGMYWSFIGGSKSPMVDWEPAGRGGTGPDTDGDGKADTCDADDDNDGDGDYTDCADLDASIYTGAAEVCDGVDNDCDGVIDDGVKTVWYVDADSDGYGNKSVTTSACSKPTGYVSNSTDCDDTKGAVNPAATETCNSVDDDCDGSTDEGVGTTYYRDADVDAYGDASKPTTGCSAPTGYVSASTDCDDTKSGVNPAATEICNTIDDDCDGSTDEGVTSTYYRDSDTDSYGDVLVTATGCSAPSGYTGVSTDCDDTRGTVYPGAPESCNAIDDDCDGTVDDGAKSTFYRDADTDGYGDVAATSLACTAPSGYVADKTDCDDTYATTNPGASEYCNTRDDDCDGSIDESAVDATTWYADSDGDSYGDAANPYGACAAPADFVADDSDCDDTDGTIYPSAPEIPYDGIDQDCDGDDVDDADGDGYAAEAAGGTDCDDSDLDTHPTASETADGVDDDCDGVVDETTDWHDDDGDGFAEEGGDCDDGDATVRPGVPETCDGVDEDCDGTEDEGTDCYDDDGDNITEDEGDCDDTTYDTNPFAAELPENGVDDDCDGTVDAGAVDEDGDGYTESGGDCDLDDAAVHPGARETADGVDNDCDGLIDDGTEAYDDDGDGFSELFGDCDDTNDDTHTDADEVVGNGVDDDCDGEVDEGGGATDDDGDGYSEDEGDCDDFHDVVAPGTEEVVNGVDDDCDGLIDELTDQDRDGFTTEEGDCDDEDGWTGPAFTELCDRFDNDCDGEVDEGCDAQVEVPVDEKGCGCDAGTTGAGMAAWLGLIGAFGFRRRR